MFKKYPSSAEKEEQPKKSPLRIPLPSDFSKPILYSDEHYYTLVNKERRIMLYSDIEEAAAYVINFKLRGMNTLDKKKPIYLEINSCGGEMSAGFSIIDTMNSIEAPVITIVNGLAASMAFTIAISGKKRYATQHAWFMQHPISEMMGEEYASFIKDRTAFLTKIEKQTDEILRQHTKLSEEEIIRIRNGELWLTAKEAKRKGIIDKII